MADAPTTEARLTGTVPLYKTVEPLNRTKHKTYGVKSIAQPFSFLKDWHFVPAIAGEFTVASGSYPIIFLGDKKMPVLVMGLRQGTNVFVNADGQFDTDHYVPAYVRRYPFVSASNPMDQPSTVCVDVDAPFVVKKDPDVPFFNEEGEPTEYTSKAVEFVSAFENDAKITESFVERLTALDLFEQKNVRVADPNNPDNTITVAEYWGVSDEKFANLPTEKLVEMHKNGDLLAISAHLISLQRWERIMRRVSVQQQAAAAPAAKA
ncbi:SapC family protein [Maricaulis sp.]|uniref:SapC family protein n=1 Tax=Maricaulis sp. TaxID=1486257 RepID=UPI003A93144F